MKKIISAILCLAMVLCACACQNTSDVSNAESDGKDDNNACALTLTLGGEAMTAEFINCIPDDGKIAIYTHDYADDNGYIYDIDNDFCDYAAVTVRYLLKPDGSQESYIYKLDNSNASKKGTVIPYNGFVALVPLALLEGKRVKENMITDVVGYEDYISYDRTDLATLCLQNKTLMRRLTYIDPINGMPSGEQIIFITDDYQTNIPDGAVAVIVNSTASEVYRVGEIRENGIINKDEVAFVFMGKYNVGFAKKYFKQNDKLTVSGIDKLSQYSDSPAVVIDGKVYRSQGGVANLNKGIMDGVCIYDAKSASMVTPARDIDFIDVVFMDSTVCYIGSNKERVIIPTSGGFVVSFNGTSVAEAKKIKLGQVVQPIIVDTDGISDDYISYNGKTLSVDAIDDVRNVDGETVLYTPSYGASTRSNEYGTEITVVNGIITGIENGMGDAQIPQDGYVISIHKSSKGIEIFEDAKVGDNVEVVISRSCYSVTTLNVSGYNATRYQDMLIVYSDKATTESNQYGYEIQVSSDNKIIGEVYGGNADIPSGGYVLSGHGKNEDALKAIYALGADVGLDKKANTVTIITNPLLICDSAAALIKEAKQEFEYAKSRFYDLDYDLAYEMIYEIEALVAKSDAAKQDCDYVEAINYAAIAVDKLDELSYATISSKTTENRSAWYRPTEKSDADVIATLEKAKSLTINALYIETWYNGRVIGYSDIKNINHHTTYGDYDVLEGFCRLAKEYDIEIHAWVENFFIGTIENAQSDSKALANLISSDKRLLDKEGRDYYSSEYGKFVFLNPYDEECRNLVLDVYREIITKYDVAGLHLDYIRFPEWNYGTSDYGYNADIIAAFKAESGYTGDVKSLTAGTYYQKWITFRQNVINSFVKQVFDMVMEVNPDIWISCAAYPGVPDIKNKIYQDVATWVNNGWIDEVFSMTYSSDNNYVQQNASQFVSLVGDKAFYSTGLSAFGDTPSDVFAQSFDSTRAAGANGQSVFSLASVNSELWLKKSDAYAYSMVNGPYSSTAIKANRLSETLLEQIEYFNCKVKNLYGDAYVYDNLFAEVLSELEKECKAFDYDNATTAQKLDFATSAYEKLNNAYNTFIKTKVSGENIYCRNQVKQDIKEMCSCLLKMQNRLSARS